MPPRLSLPPLSPPPPWPPPPLAAAFILHVRRRTPGPLLLPGLLLRRRLSATPALATKTIEIRSIPGVLTPPYPFGERLIYKQSNDGLYGLARVRVGNCNSDKRTPHARRTWSPNVQEKRFRSEALRAWVRTRMTTRVFRTIIKEGGIDKYVLGDKTRRIRDLGPAGWRLRWLVLQAPAVRLRMDDERRRLGLSVRKEEAVEIELAEEGGLRVRAAASVAASAAAAAPPPPPSAAAASPAGTSRAPGRGRRRAEDSNLAGRAQPPNQRDLPTRPPAENRVAARIPSRERTGGARQKSTRSQRRRDRPRRPAPMTVSPVPQKPDMWRVAMDYATPGKISRRNRDMMDAYLAGTRDQGPRSRGKGKGRAGGTAVAGDLRDFGIGLAGEGNANASEGQRRMRRRRFARHVQRPDRPGSLLTRLLGRERATGRVGTGALEVRAAQAIQVREMKALVQRRNVAERASMKARRLRRRYKLRM